MWDWDIDDWFEFGRKQNEMLEEWKNIGKSKEQIQREKEAQEQRERAKHTPPPTYHDPVWLILYIIVMVVGAIFTDRWLIWIAATVIYLNYLRK